jgi:hypothetical protein
MQTVPRIKKQVKQLPHDLLVSKPVRKRARNHYDDTELNFSEKLVDMVDNEYPESGEEASVLISKVWNLIDQEIMKGMSQVSSQSDFQERINVVSAFYDLAVQRLRDMNRPLLKPGAVADYYRSL